MDIETVAVVIVAVCLISVYREQRENADQLQTLPQDVGQGGVVRSVIVRIHGENTSCQCVHHIFAGSFHNNIPHKACGKAPVTREKSLKFCKFLLVRKFVKQKKIGYLLKTESVLRGKALYQVLDIVTSVEQTAVGGNSLSVDDFGSSDIGDSGQSCENALSV